MSEVPPGCGPCRDTIAAIEGALRRRAKSVGAAAYATRTEATCSICGTLWTREHEAVAFYAERRT